MDLEKVDKLIRFVLLVAGTEDDFRSRSLGQIHFIKYVFLADLAYAARHGGATFTSAPWRFHHFGPWAAPVQQRIEPALAVYGVQRNELESKYGEDFVRWQWRDDGELICASRLYATMVFYLFRGAPLLAQVILVALVAILAAWAFNKAAVALLKPRERVLPQPAET